jgi:hypothetical protein
VAVLAAASAAAASTVLKAEPEPPLNVRPIEAAVKAKVAEQTPVKSVACPRTAPAVPRIKLGCAVTLAGNDQKLIAIVDHRGARNDVALRLR